MTEKGPLPARAILAYLVDHPDAQDTLAGIANWWLLEQRIKTETAIVREALEELVSAGLIQRRRGEDTQLHYRINRSKLSEVRELLEKQ